MEDMIRLLAAELGQKPQHVGAVVRLLDEGNTIPFIARYRKEQHGAMDDTTLRTLAERLQYLRNLAQRREEIRRSIAAQEKLTDELDAALQAAVTLSELEDLYRPYKPKRRTRATIARERGLAPLAEHCWGRPAICPIRSRLPPDSQTRRAAWRRRRTRWPVRPTSWRRPSPMMLPCAKLSAA